MTRGDAVHPLRFRYERQPRIAGVARCGLQVSALRFGLQIAALHPAWQLQRRGEFRDEFGMPLAFRAAQAVVEMGDHEATGMHLD